jgi:hypothetical protein
MQQQQLSPSPSLPHCSGTVAYLLIVPVGVKRAHLVDARLDGGMLLELYSRDGVGTMISTDFYEGIRRAASRDLEAIAVSVGGGEPCKGEGLRGVQQPLGACGPRLACEGLRHTPCRPVCGSQPVMLFCVCVCMCVWWPSCALQALLEPLQRTGVLVRRTPAELRSQLQHFTVIERETKVGSAARATQRGLHTAASFCAVEVPENRACLPLGFAGTDTSACSARRTRKRRTEPLLGPCCLSLRLPACL